MKGSVGASRMRAQLLAGPPAAGVLEAVERVVGVQAQSMPAARLAVRVRTRGVTAADVDRALAAGELARTWLMRGTLHVVAAADLGGLSGLVAPVNLAAGRRRREGLGIDTATAGRALAEIPSLLAGEGPVGRAELISRLAGRGVRIDPSGQAPAHLVAFAAMSGLICRGPDLARGEPSVVLAAGVADEVAGGGRRFSGDAALRELARRYLLGYGPAGAGDFAAWSGLPAPTARRAFDLLGGASGGASSDRSFGDRSFDGRSFDGRSFDESSGRAPEPAGERSSEPVGDRSPEPAAGRLVSLVPRLLGQFDTVLLGHRDRSFVVPAEHAKRINAGGGMIAATLLVGGRVAGLWRRAGRRVTLQPFEGPAALPGAARDGLEADVDDLGRFLGERLTAGWE